MFIPKSPDEGQGFDQGTTRCDQSGKVGSRSHGPAGLVPAVPWPMVIASLESALMDDPYQLARHIVEPKGDVPRFGEAEIQIGGWVEGVGHGSLEHQGAGQVGPKGCTHFVHLENQGEAHLGIVRVVAYHGQHGDVVTRSQA